MPHAAAPRRTSPRFVLPATALAFALACCLVVAAAFPARALASSTDGDSVFARLGSLFASAIAADDEADADPAAGRTSEEPASATAETLLREAIASFTTELTDLQDLGITVGELRDTLDNAISRDPRCDLYSGCTWTYREDADDTDDCTVVAIELRYLLTDEQVATYQETWDAAFAQLVAAADGAGDTYEAVRAVHDYLASNCRFDADSATSSSAYGAVVEGRAANRGFADAFALALDELGIEAVVVYGDSGVPWNMVQIDGSWYHVDVAWDAVGLDAEQPAVPSTDYFLVDDARMEQAHGTWATGTPDAPAAPQSYGSLVAGTTADEHVSFAKGLWRQMFDGLQTELGGLGMYGVTTDEAYQAYDELVAEDPLYDYIDSYGAAYAGDSGIVSSLRCTYRLTAEEFADYTARREEAIAAALAGTEGLEPYAQVLAVHDYLVRTCAYGDPESAVDHTAYGALLSGQAVCEGYASAFRILMDRLGIPCIVVSSEEMEHGWNMVQLDGQWYHVDVTWDDPTPDRGPDADVSHRFLLRGDDYMAANEHYGWESPYEAPSDHWSQA